MKIYISLIICGCIWMLVSFGFSGSMGIKQQNEMIDLGSGTFYLRGTKTHSENPCFYCEYHENIHTRATEFSVNIKPVEGKKDTLRFYGLEGADAGEFGRRVFPDCTRPDDCVIYAKISGDLFEIDISNEGHLYQAQGILKPGTSFELEGRYSYGDVSIDYSLKGQRVLLPRELKSLHH